MVPINQGRMRKTSPVGSLLMAVILGGVIAFMAVDSAKWAKVDRQYHRAPGCFAGATADPALPPCTVKAYTVTKAYEYESGGRTSTTHWMLDLRAKDGETRSIGVEDETLWNSLGAGQPVKVQLWQGKSRIVYANGLAGQTANNPDYRSGVARRTLLVFGSINGAVVLFLLWATYMAYRLRQVSRPVAPVWYSSSPPPSVLGASLVPPPIGFGSAPPGFNASPPMGAVGQPPASVAGQWQGVYRYASGALDDTPFTASFEVSAGGTISGRMLDYNQLGEATVSGEQAGTQIRFLKQYVNPHRLTSRQAVEYMGELSPDGQTITGQWQLTSRLLGIPFKTVGYWSASRVSVPAYGAHGPVSFPNQ